VYRSTGSLPTDSSPLLGASVYFNFLDGSITNRAFAVAGDVSNDIEHTNLGLRIGGKYISKHTAEEGYKFKELSTVDASARYIFAREEGVKAGSIIKYQDIPFLETAALDYEKAKLLKFASLIMMDKCRNFRFSSNFLGRNKASKEC